MNEIIKQESAVSLFGIDARAFGVVANTETGRILNQKIGTNKEYVEGGQRFRISVRLRFDDECHNGHESFSITGAIDEYRNGRFHEFSSGCIHEEIAAHFPQLAHCIKWHLTSTDGPMHYVGNTCYLAGDKDCYGLAKGEKRQIIGRDGSPLWELVAVNSLGVKISTTPTGLQYQGAETVPLFILEKDHKGDTPPAAPALKWVPSCRIGEGKARDLAAARRAAVWPDATDEELNVPRAELEEKLTARLPALLAEFKAAMLSCGFILPKGE